MDLPGFMTLYKDKFFSKIKDFIDDKNYIFTLKNNFNKKCEERDKSKKIDNSESSEDKNDFLGLKRNRAKEDKLSAYDTELKLLENDYPQIIDNSDEFMHDNIQIKKEKIDDDELNVNEINKDINKNSAIPLNTTHTISEQKSKTHKNNKSMNNKNKSVDKIFANKSKKGVNVKYSYKKKHLDKNASISTRISKNRKGRTQNSSIKKLDVLKILTPVKSYHYNNIVTNVFDSSIYTTNYAINHFQEKNQKNTLYGINSRLDNKMPKINICKKKRYQINYSAKRWLGSIKDKLSNRSLKSKIHRKRKYLSDDKKRRDELKNLNQIVNNNFYGKERLKSPDVITLEDSVSVNNENNINTLKIKKLNKRKNIKIPKINEAYNKNVLVICNRIILSKKKKKGKMEITKVGFSGESIIIYKKALNMKEIQLPSKVVLPKENIEELNKDNQNHENLDTKEKKRLKKIPKKTIIKSVRKIHARRSSRIRELQRAKYKKEKELQKLQNKERTKRRKRRFKKRTKKKEQKKPKKAKHSESKKFDSRGESNISTINQIRTNQEKDTVILNENEEDDRILALKTNNIESLSDGVRYYHQRRSKFKSNSSITSGCLDDIDAVKGFNLLFNQK